MPVNGRSFLFLPGPHSPFFRRLGAALRRAGCAVCNIQLCGGDVVHWSGRGSIPYSKAAHEWPLWISNLLDTRSITDVVLLGDWRALHRECVLLARQKNIRVWVYEEGYLRPNYVTLEEGGVNATSPLSKDPHEIRALAAHLRTVAPDVPVSHAPNHMTTRVRETVLHHVGNVVLWPFFRHYRTHRPYCIGHELMGWLPRFLSRRTREADSQKTLKHFFQQQLPYYLLPLQLDADVQMRRYSPFSGVLEALAVIITNFACHAPKNTYLLIKNHPLDNGLIPYRRYARSMGHATGCASRLRFVEDGNTRTMIQHSLGLVLCNSTVGLTALQEHKPVFCLGNSVYALQGLATCEADIPLESFWTTLPLPDTDLLRDFLTVLQQKSLIPGNFYDPHGMEDAINASLHRMQVLP